MPRSSRLAVVFLGLPLFLAGCRFSSAKITGSSLTDEFDRKEVKAKRTRTVFATNQEKIYDVVSYAYCPKGTKVAVVWKYLGGPPGSPPPQQIDRVEQEIRGTGRVAFSLSRPNKGWPRGKYAAEIYLNDKLARTDTFEVK